MAFGFSPYGGAGQGLTPTFPTMPAWKPLPKPPPGGFEGTEDLSSEQLASVAGSVAGARAGQALGGAIPQGASRSEADLKDTAARLNPPPPAGPGPRPIQQSGGWEGDQWTSGAGGYEVPNPALDMPPGDARNRAENKWKKERDAWISKVRGPDALKVFKEKEDASWRPHATNIDEAAKAKRVGPKYNVEAPTWEVGDYGTAESYDLGDPYKVAQLGDQERVDPRSMSAQNFNPYRRQALGDVDQTTARSLANAESALARSGGLSTADRMALASQANRQKIEGRQGALGRIDMMESANRYGTQAANIAALNRGGEFNAAEANRRASETRGLETQAGRDVWGERLQQGKLTAAEQNIRDRATTSSQNRRAEEIAKGKYGRDRDQYASENQKFILGKQLDYGDLTSQNLSKESGKGGNWLERPTLRPVNQWF